LFISVVLINSGSGTPGTIGTDHSGKPALSLTKTGQNPMKGQNFQIILMSGDSQMRCPAQSLFNTQPIRDKYICRRIMEFHSFVMRDA
jgi:hypothetical protein